MSTPLLNADTDRDAWLAARRLGIGASEIAVCSVEGCCRLRSSRGLCHTHYTGARRRGELELLPPPNRRDQIYSRVETDATGCWLWTGTVDHNGYGYLRSTRSRHQAHRLAYETLVGAIPDGLQLDHLCRVRRCVNPAHLEPVTARENVGRGVGPSAHAIRTDHCVNGHRFDAANTFTKQNGTRGCRACARAATRRSAARRRGAA